MRLTDYGPWTEFRIIFSDRTNEPQSRWFRGHQNIKVLLGIKDPLAYINIHYFLNGNQLRYGTKDYPYEITRIR